MDEWNGFYDEMDNLQFGKRFVLLSELFNFVARKRETNVAQ